MQTKIKNLVNELNPNLSQNERNLAIETMQGYWDCVGADMTKMVTNKHKLPQTTQDYYGSYLELLSFLRECKVSLEIAGLILILAGAKVEGVKSAVQIMNGRI